MNTINNSSRVLTSQILPIIKSNKELFIKIGNDNQFLSHRYINSGLKKYSSYLSLSSSK